MLITTILALGTITPAWGQAREIAEIRIQGLKHIPEENVRVMLSIRVGDVLTTEELRSKLERDMDMLWERGFFARRPEYTFEVDTRGRWVVTITVVEHAVVKEITIEGNTALPDEELINLMATKPGQVLNEATLVRDMERIQEYYREKGYVAIVVAHDFQEDTGKLVLRVEEARVAGIRISGLKKTKEKLIRLTIRTKVGDIFNRKSLAEDWHRLKNLELFKTVEIEPTPDPQGRGVILNYKFAEENTGIATAGLGASSRGEFVGYVLVQEKNLAGLGQLLRLNMEFFDRRTWEIYYERPWLDTRGTRMAVHIYDTRFYRQPQMASLIGAQLTTRDVLFTEERRGIRLTFRRPRSRYDERVWYGLTLRNEDVSFVQRRFVAGQLVPVGPEQSEGRVMGIQVSYELDTRDLFFDPSRGTRRIIACEVAPKLLGGERAFQKINLDWRWYRPLGGGKLRVSKEIQIPKNVLAMRLLAGYAFGDVPIFENYFVGGPENLRGYRIDRFVGQRMLVLNVEVRHRLNRNIQLVLFGDAGDAWGGPHSMDFKAAVQGIVKRRESLSPHYGYGIGIRFTTPLGLFRFDFALNDEGGSRFHVSVGQTF